MKIIIGLGNPGNEYANTRHNVGFTILDEIQNNFSFSEWKFNKKFDAEISKGNINQQEVLLAKPQTFMNLSGISTRSIMDFYKLTPEDILVIQDDLDIEIGTYKVSNDSRSAGHNGIQNIIDQIGTQKFTRFRIGIGAITTNEPSCRLGAHDFVLGKFTETEKEKIQKTISSLLEDLNKYL